MNGNGRNTGHGLGHEMDDGEAIGFGYRDRDRCSVHSLSNLP